MLSKVLIAHLAASIAIAADVEAGSFIEIPLNRSATRRPTDIDGPWPILRVTYGDSKFLETYPTLWGAPILVRQQHCADEISNTTLLCSDDLYPESFYDGDRSNYTLTPGWSRYRAPDEVMPQGNIHPKWLGELSYSLDPMGNISIEDVELSVQGIDMQTPALVGDNMTIAPYNSTRQIPMLHSFCSLSQLAVQAKLNNATSSEFFSMHYGSIDPEITPSLILGGYDNNRIQGDLMGINTSDAYTTGVYEPLLSLTDMSIGVEEGFLPLQSLANNNNSYVQGPFKIDPGHMTSQQWSYLSSITIEPASPYLHLSRSICDGLAAVLDLTYDPSRNIYLWNHSPEHPIFHSPTFLEFGLSATSSDQFESPDSLYNQTRANVTIKIPFALLQHTYSATTLSLNGTESTGGQRYFPCAPTDYEYTTVSWGKYNRLGRAFLQSAFLGANFGFLNPYGDSGTINRVIRGEPRLWLAQAPGPKVANDEHMRELVPIASSGFLTNRTNVTLPPNAWTKSWEGFLPVWTVDSDGSTTLDDLNGRVVEANNLGLKVGVPIASISVLLICGWCILSSRRSRRKWNRIRKEISEEDATAIEIERLLASSREKEMISLDDSHHDRRSSLEANTADGHETMIPSSGQEELEREAMLGNSHDTRSMENDIDMTKERTANGDDAEISYLLRYVETYKVDGKES